MDPFKNLNRRLNEQLARYTNKERTTKDIAYLILRVFSTPDGMDLLEVLEDTFVNVPLFVPGDSHVLAYNAGHADLIQYIKDSIKIAKGEYHGDSTRMG